MAGAGVLTYFAGAGVCSPPAKLRKHLSVCDGNYNRTSAKEFMIDNYGILCCFVYHCGVYKMVGRILNISENFIEKGETVKHHIKF